MAKEKPTDSEPKTPVRARRERDSLSREVILDAARTIAEREGLDGLTFQAIGRQLGAHPTSVYRHYRDKDELLLDLIDSLRARSYGGTLIPSDDWREDLRLAATVVHDHLLRYPTFAVQMAARTTRRPTEFSNVEFVLQALLRAGIAPGSAALVLRAFGNYVRSSASMEASLLTLSAETRQADNLAWEVEYRQLDPAAYPSITSLAEPLAPISDPGAFWTGLELLLDGIAARAERESGIFVDDEAAPKTVV